MPESGLMLLVDSHHSTILSSNPSECMLEWIIAAYSSTSYRYPISLAVVVDIGTKSDSEVVGSIISAIREIISHMKASDHLVLLIPEDRGEQIQSATLNHMPAKDNIEIILDKNNDLASMWQQAITNMEYKKASHLIRHVLIISNGHASIIPGRLRIAQSRRDIPGRRDIYTSVIAVGKQSDDILLESFASENEGRYYYANDFAELIIRIREESIRLFSLIAHHARLEVESPEDVGIRIIGVTKSSNIRTSTSIDIGHVCAGEKRSIFMRVALPVSAPGTKITLRGIVSTDANELAASEQVLIYQSPHQIYKRVENHEVLRRASIIENVTVASHLLCLRQDERTEKAGSLLWNSLIALPDMQAIFTKAGLTDYAFTDEHIRRQALAACHRLRVLGP